MNITLPKKCPICGNEFEILSESAPYYSHIKFYCRDHISLIIEDRFYMIRVKVNKELELKLVDDCGRKYTSIFQIFYGKTIYHKKELISIDLSSLASIKSKIQTLLTFS